MARPAPRHFGAVVAAVAGPAVKVGDVPAVLRRHGLDPNLDAGGLTAALLERGWAVTVEQMDTSAGTRPAQRWRALARRPWPDAVPRPFRSADHLQARGWTEAAALARVLAKALAHDEG